MFYYVPKTTEFTPAIPPLLSPKTAVVYTKSSANTTGFMRPPEILQSNGLKVGIQKQSKCTPLSHERNTICKER